MAEKIPGTILTYDGADGSHTNLPDGRFSGPIFDLPGSWVMVDWSGQIVHAHWRHEDGELLYWIAGEGSRERTLEGEV